MVPEIRWVIIQSISEVTSSVTITNGTKSNGSLILQLFLSTALASIVSCCLEVTTDPEKGGGGLILYDDSCDRLVIEAS